MKAKQAIAETRLHEAPGDPSSEPPAGSTGGTAGSRMPVRKRPQPGDMPHELPPEFGPASGRGPGGGGNQTGLLKDVLLLMCTELLGNDFDGPIARKLIDGKP